MTLTASPASGSSFASWSGACTGHSTSCTVIRGQAQSVSAQFVGVTVYVEMYQAQLTTDNAPALGHTTWPDGSTCVFSGNGQNQDATECMNGDQADSTITITACEDPGTNAGITAPSWTDRDSTT